MTTPQITAREFAYVRIQGPGAHESVTERLSLAPTEARNIGDINRNTGRPQRNMGWILRSGFNDSSPLDQHIDQLLAVLRTRADQFRSLWVEYDIVLQRVGYYPSSIGSGMHFSREVVRQAAQLGVAIDMDHYFVESHGHGG